MTRNRRAGVEDRWTKSVRDADGNTQTVPSVNHGKGKRWRARYVDDRGREHAKGFTRKVDAQKWLDKQTAAIVSGSHVAPRDAQLTVEQWCDLWIEGYKVNREATVRAARTHIRQIIAEFGGMPLSAVRPSQVKAWVARLRADNMEASYVYALHSRLVADHVRRGARWRAGPQPVLAADITADGQAQACMSRQRNRSGRSTMRCPTICGSRSCWARSPVCGWPKHLAWRCPMWISLGEWCTRNSSGPTSR